MPEVRLLHQILGRAATIWPERIAIEDGERSTITYRELDRLSDAACERLRSIGVRPGDRVAFCMRKSIDAVATIFGTLKAGAAYVPLDPSAPGPRNGAILRDAEVAAMVAERQWAEVLRADLAGPDSAAVLALDGVGDGSGLRDALATEGPGFDRDPALVIESEQPAYILYTSGSTGSPKGVVISHRAALSFVGWCSAAFGPMPEDAFSSHAPFHFDLSVLDLFVAIHHGARVVLISESVGKDPLRLADLIAARKISIWYSVPSVLMMLASYGKLDRWAFPALRQVLFAGEVFPIVHLRAIQSLWPSPRYFNLYGPTETNVCTFFEVPAIIPEARTRPYPIGRACAHFRAIVVDESGELVDPGSEGELCVSGPAVMSEYWKRPDDTARAFFAIGPAERWYRTGDLVIEEDGGLYDFRGRRDRMVKRRGYRIELAEVEAALHRHPGVREAAVVALPSQDDGLRLKAFLSFQNAPHPSVIALKRFCAEVLPSYMVPDLFEFPEVLPRTSTGKIDYQRLQNAGPGAGRESMDDR
jgi:amino acid adenylation domain-containing protein